MVTTVRLYRPDRVIHQAVSADADRTLCGRSTAGLHCLDSITNAWDRVACAASAAGPCERCAQAAARIAP